MDGSQKGLNSCTFYSRDSQLQSPFPTGHAEYMGSKTGRPILQVVTQEEKAQSVEQQVGALTPSFSLDWTSYLKRDHQALDAYMFPRLLTPNSPSSSVQLRPARHPL